MTERGMIFNAEMVRAIMDGRKTQTRRIMKVQPSEGFSPMNMALETDYNARWYTPAREDSKGYLHPCKHQVFGVANDNEGYTCPFGHPGDRIWVRETWAQLGNEDGCAIDWNDNLVKDAGAEAARIYRASCTIGDYGLWQIPDDAFWKPHTDDRQYEGTWRPSIHMPRWASRITLEITKIRVDRLQNISETDAEAEGIDMEALFDAQDYYDCIADHNMTGRPTVTGAFKYLWESIYGDESWQANPWCWVIEFRRLGACSD